MLGGGNQKILRTQRLLTPFDFRNASALFLALISSWRLLALVIKPLIKLILFKYSIVKVDVLYGKNGLILASSSSKPDACGSFAGVSTLGVGVGLVKLVIRGGEGVILGFGP